MDPVTFTFLLGRLGRLTESIATDVCADADTTPAELRVLSALMHTPEGSASPRVIAASIVQTSGGLTATLNRLEQRGWIDRQPDPDDGRGRLVIITDEGRRFSERLIGELADATVAALGDLDIADVGPTMRSILEAFERDAGMISSAGFVAGNSGVSA